MVLSIIFYKQSNNKLIEIKLYFNNKCVYFYYMLFYLFSIYIIKKKIIIVILIFYKEYNIDYGNIHLKSELF